MYCEIQPFDVEKSYFDERQPRGVILSGGPETVTSGDTPRIPERLLELEIPILGICYGMQALAAQLGGGVKSSAHREFCLLYTSPSPRDATLSRMPSSA